jgi:alkylhydroperoxidase family enzyme
MTARVPLVDPLEEAVRREGSPPGGNNLHRAIANLPEVARGQRDLIRAIASGLGRRSAELAILRYAALANNAYCWSHHAVLGRQAGLSETEIQALRDGRSDVFTGSEQALLTFVEAVSLRRMNDAGWADAGKHFSVETRLRLVLLVAFYSMMTLAWLALDVPIDEGLS